MFQVGQSRGAREKKALYLVAALVLQKSKLFDGFDAFRHGLHPEGASKANDGADDRIGVAILAQRGYEMTVDFDAVEWKGMQRAEGGIASPEIVECKTDAELLERCEGCPRRRGVFQKHAFRHLKL